MTVDHEDGSDAGEALGLGEVGVSPDWFGPAPFAAIEPVVGPTLEEVGALLAATRPMIRSVLRQYWIRAEDSEDLVQSALLVVLAHWPEIREPAAYLVGALRRLCQRHWRAERGERALRARLSGAQAESGGEVPQERVERRVDAERLFAGLPAEWRQIVALRYGEELSSQDVGLAMGCTPARVRQCAHRAVLRMREVATGSR